jgi:DNA-directed RNA polymerase subunit RPC12/RpoP
MLPKHLQEAFEPQHPKVKRRKLSPLERSQIQQKRKRDRERERERTKRWNHLVKHEKAVMRELFADVDWGDPLPFDKTQCDYCGRIFVTVERVTGVRNKYGWVVRHAQFQEEVVNQETVYACPDCAHRIPYDKRKDLIHTV